MKKSMHFHAGLFFRSIGAEKLELIASVCQGVIHIPRGFRQPVTTDPLLAVRANVCPCLSTRFKPPIGFNYALATDHYRTRTTWNGQFHTFMV